MRYRNLLITVLAFLSSCTHSDSDISKYVDDNRIFSSYLDRQFHAPISQDSTDYVIVPATSCSGCVENSLRVLQKDKKAKIIVSQASYNMLKSESDFKVDGNYFIDYNNEINKMKYGMHNICIIQAHNQLIYNILTNIREPNADLPKEMLSAILAVNP